MKMYRIKLWMLLFSSILLIVSCSKDNDIKSKQTLSRKIELDGQTNFRDIGGYKTVDGRTVKWGKVFRSGELAHLSDSDLKIIDSLGISTVMTFLTETEIEQKGKDRLPTGVNSVSIPIDNKSGNEGLAQVILRARQTGDFSEVPLEVNPEIHRLLINVAKEEYANVFREIIKSNEQPVVYHCSHGVHRTGTATALLLSALGVPWETVREDYLLSNKYRKEEIEKRLGELRLLAAKNQGIKPEEVDMKNAEAFYILKGEYLDASQDEMIKQYGSIDNYISEGLGITDKEIAQLKNIMLE